MRQTSSINEVAWALVSAVPTNSEEFLASHAASGNGRSVSVAIGDFDIDATKSYLDSKSILSIQTGNYVLYTSGKGSAANSVFFTLLDSRTIAFGPLEPLKRVLKIRDGEEDSLLQNQRIMTLIQRANGDCIFWGVLNSTGATNAIKSFVPEAVKFPQSRDLIGKLKEVLIKVKVPDDIEINFQAAASTSSDAVLISQLLQAGVLMRRYQTNSENNPEMAKLLDALRVAANGDLLDISPELTNDQLISLIEHNIFIMKM